MNLQDLERAVAFLESQPPTPERDAQTKVCLKAAEALLNGRCRFVKNGMTLGGGAALALLGHFALIPIAAGALLGRIASKPLSEADPMRTRVVCLIDRCNALLQGTAPHSVDIPDGN